MGVQGARPRWSALTKLVVVVGILTFAIYLLTRFREVIPPFILSAILAFILSPLVDRMEARLPIRRGLATALVYLVMFGVLALLLALLIPVLVNQFQVLNIDLQAMILHMERLLGQGVVIAGYPVNLSQAIDQLLTGLRNVLEPVFGQTLGFLVDVITSFVWVVFIVVISFYLIKDGRHLRQWIDRQIPQVYQADYLKLKREIYGIWSDFFRGQIVLAVVVSVIFTVVGLIIGLPFALAMAVFAGLMEFIPSLGHGIWLVSAVLLTLFQGSTWLPIPNLVMALIVVGLHIFYQQVDLNYLIPRIIGRRVHLHPLVVILGIVAGAVLAGVLGIVLAAPTIASARVLGRWVRAYLLDQEPWYDQTQASGAE